jgi:hypothetical protein
MTVVSVEYRKADDLPQRRPTKSEDRSVGSWPPRGRKELSVKCGARDPIFEGVVETVDKDEEITARIGQVARYIRSECALVCILNGR